MEIFTKNICNLEKMQPFWN